MNILIAMFKELKLQVEALYGVSWNPIAAPIRNCHLAVCIGHCIIVFGGKRNHKAYSTHTFSMYNLFTEEWKTHAITPGKFSGQRLHSACAVAIGADVVLLGGHGSNHITTNYITNAVWKLSRNHKGEFSWSCMTSSVSLMKPSPRTCHTGWEYGEKLWMFGGVGTEVCDYLNDNGDFTWRGENEVYNNQLLCFDPCCAKWTNPQCSGNIPQPRAGHVSAILGGRVWLTGGFDQSHTRILFNDLHQLDLDSLVWTKVQIFEPKPHERHISLTGIPHRDLLLHGSFKRKGELVSQIWMFDLLSASWRQHATALSDECSRICHSVTLGINNVIVIGGHSRESIEPKPLDILHVMLEPKSLQQLAVKTIHQHKDILPWKVLPKSLSVTCLISYELENIDFGEGLHHSFATANAFVLTNKICLTLTLPSPYVGMVGSLTVTVA